MAFWNKGKANMSMMQINQKIKKAILDGDEKEEARLRASKAQMMKDKQGKKKPLSKKKSMVG